MKNLIRLKNFTFFFSFLILLPAVSQSQTLDEVLEAHFEVMGQEKLAELTSIQQKGTVMTQGMEFPITTVLKRPDMIRVDASIGGMDAVFMAYDGTNGWQIMPMMGSSDPVDLPEAQLKDAMQNADMDGPLYNYEEKGHSVELVGTEEVEGTDTYHLKVTLKSGDTINYYLDAESYVPIKISSKAMMQGQEIESEQYLGNYKMVDGIAMAHSMETKMGGMTAMEITIDSVTLNVDIEDSYFEKPTSGSSDQ